MCLATALNLIGGACEIAGFLLVSIDLHRLQRHEFGPLWLERALGASRALIRRIWRKLTRQKPSVHYGSATGAGRLSGSAHGIVRAGTSGKSLEERVEALEFNFRELDKEIDQERVRLNMAIGQVQANLDAALDDLQRKREQREEKERALRRQSLRFQWAGIPLFLLGVVFSVAGNVNTC